MTGSFNILKCIFEKKHKKRLKIRSQDRKKVIFGKFILKYSEVVLFGSFDFNFNFFAIFSKMRLSISTAVLHSCTYSYTSMLYIHKYSYTCSWLKSYKVDHTASCKGVVVQCG